MDIQERAKWLRRSKLGLCLPLKTDERVLDSGEQQQNSLEKTLRNILQRQEEMEKNFNSYLREEHGVSFTTKRKTKTTKQYTKKKQNIDQSKSVVNKKWISFS